MTLDAIIAFQTNAAALLTPDNLVSPHGFTIRQLDRNEIPRPKHRIFLPVCWYHPLGELSAADYGLAATALECTPAAIQAVGQTETKRAAWDGMGRPTILFEPRYFSRLTHSVYDRSHPDISHLHWHATVSNPKEYGQFNLQFPRLARAAVLNEQAALKSASWGSFQIMGANHTEAGFREVDSFVTAMMLSVKEHLAAFVSFIKSDPVRQKALQNLDWATFAKHYNGPDYKKFDYDGNTAQAYAALTSNAARMPRATTSAQVR